MLVHIAAEIPDQLGPQVLPKLAQHKMDLVLQGGEYGYSIPGEKITVMDITEIPEEKLWAENQMRYAAQLPPRPRQSSVPPTREDLLTTG